MGLMRHVGILLKKRLVRVAKSSDAADVLFITIDDELLNRYRAGHMIESLESMGVTVSEVRYYNLSLDDIRRHNVFIFCRCPWMPEYEKLFKEIKKRNKITIYEVDDLVIDRKYTDTLKVVQDLVPEEREIYDDGVYRHGKLMQACDYAITTTNELAAELQTYKNLKEVFINRNSMSEEMLHHSNEAIKTVERDEDSIVVGYFSGTHTHNEDFQMVAPAIVKVLKKYKNTKVKIAGRIDTPEEFEGFDDRIIHMPYVDWRKLPSELRECDIILSPLVDTVFNRAKSEIKWAEAALVGVPVVASDIGAFSDSIRHEETGLLVDNNQQAWFEALDRLVANQSLREKLSQNSREYIVSNYMTTGRRAELLKAFIDRITPEVIAFGAISLADISGGNIVIKKHMDILRQAGKIVYGVETMDYRSADRWIDLNDKDDENYDILRINSHRKKDRVILNMALDKFVATFWGSVNLVDGYAKSGKKLYLVQGMEADFYNKDNQLRRKVLSTYRNTRLEPITISKWCQSWLLSDFDRKAKYAPNGLSTERYTYNKRKLSGKKVKILIEGSSKSTHKNVDEAFEITNKLDKKKFEIGWLSGGSEAKDWYRADEIYQKISPELVGDVYRDYDILLKTSLLESFSYPPIEIMATGGFSVVIPNGGNVEYLKDEENCLMFESGDHDKAIDQIHRIVNDKNLRCKLEKNGLEMAKKRDWNSIASDIRELYEEAL